MVSPDQAGSEKLLESFEVLEKTDLEKDGSDLAFQKEEVGRDTPDRRPGSMASSIHDDVPILSGFSSVDIPLEVSEEKVKEQKIEISEVSVTETTQEQLISEEFVQEVAI